MLPERVPGDKFICLAVKNVVKFSVTLQGFITLNFWDRSRVTNYVGIIFGRRNSYRDLSDFHTVISGELGIWENYVLAP